MKIIFSFKGFGLVLAALLSLGTGSLSPVFGQQTVSYLIDLNSKAMTQLGSLGGDTFARAINDAGQVAGSSFLGKPAPNFEPSLKAFITGPNGMGIRNLGVPRFFASASDINDAGQVVGTSQVAPDAPSSGYITGSNGMGVMDLSTL